MTSEDLMGFAIVGLSGRFPGARTVKKFWENVLAGRSSVTRFASDELEDAFDEATRKDPDYVPARPILDDVELFDADYFGMSPREADLTDPQQRVFLEICSEALESAGYDPARYAGLIGVFAGSSLNTYFLRHVCPDRAAIDRFTSEYQVGCYSELLGALNDFVATRVAYKLNLRGPAVAVQSACSTSLLAVAQACQSLAMFQCDMALAGGVSITLPQKRGYLHQAGGMASPDGDCRPFDAQAAGTVFGSGAGVVLIKRLADAIADRDSIYAVIKGFGVNNDGAEKVGFTAPSVGGQAACITSAMAMADFDAESVDYVECHGTATPLGDPIEIEGLTQAFSELARGDLEARPQPCVLGSVKANVGHLDVAAGVVGLIKTTLMLSNRVIPPQIHFDQPNPRLDFTRGRFRVAAGRENWEAGAGPRRAGVSAFGVGGTNVHLCLEEAPEPPVSNDCDDGRPLVLPLSARNTAALKAMSEQLAEALEASVTDGAPPLRDIAHTLQTGRRVFDHRAAIVATSVNEAVEQLRRLRVDAPPVGAAAPRIVFMFPGQGAQYPGMGRALYDSDPAFRADVDAGAAIVLQHLGQDLRQIMFADQNIDEESAHPIRSTTLAQPALFLHEYAMARRLMRLGLEPFALIGHSLGELVAAVLAGVMSYDDALRFVVNRGRIMQAQPAGAMLSVRLAKRDLQGYLPEGAEIASDNAPNLCVASGPFEAIAELETRLSKAGVAHRRLHTSHAFHSAMMEPVVQELEAIAATLDLRAPRRRLASTVTGRWLTDAEAVSPSYWARQCREPVAFRDSLEALLKDAADVETVLVEVGPGRTLSTFAQSAQARARAVVSTAPDFLDRGEEELIFAEALGALWTHGVALKPFCEAAAGAPRALLPTYPFQRKRHWIERPPVNAASDLATPAVLAQVPGAAATSLSRSEPAASHKASNEDGMSQAIVTSLKTILSEISGRALSDGDHAASFLALGFDSLLLGQVAQRVNKTFGVKVTFRQLMRDLNTVDALAAMLKASAPPDRLPAVAAPQPPTAAPALDGPPASSPRPIAAPVTEGASGALQAVVREQLQTMERLFAAQIAAARGSAVDAPPAQAPAGAAPPAPELLMPASEAAPSRFRMYRPGGGDGDHALTPRQRRFIDDLVRRYTAKTAGSKARTQASRGVLADPRTASGFHADWKEIIYPLVCSRSKGSLIWDVDGNEYIDLVNGYGQTMFGHAPDFVLDALRAQLDQGFAIGPQTPLAGEVAARISAMTGNERVAFCNTGSEAVMAAMRVARAVTGRDKVIMLSGAYHGQFDEVLIKARPAGAPVGASPIAPGIPGENVGNMIVLPNNNPRSLEVVRRMADDLAAVIVEPVQSRRPGLQPRAFLLELRDITAKSGAALVFDEVVTGFRVHPGGMQHVFGIRADLATYGKVLGGGMPIGVVAGRAEFMDALDGGTWRYGDDSAPEVAPTFFAGTFVRHPLVLAAARAVLDHIETHQEAIYQPLGEHTRQLVDRINADLARRGVPERAESYASWFYLDVSHHGALASLLYPALRLAGIHIHEGFPCFLTTEHSAAQRQAIGDAFARAYDALEEAGIIESAGARAAASGDAGAGAAQVAPLTEPQVEILLAAQMGDAASMAFNESLTVRFEGPFDAAAMTGALQDVIRRHDALRGRIGARGETLEIVSELALEIPQIDLSGGDADARLAALLAKDARTPFDLFNGPLVRAAIVKLAPERHALLFTAHHIICDGWSMNVLLEELAALYNASLGGSQAELPPAPSFGAYAAHEVRKPNAETVAFWKNLFVALPKPTELPLDRPRPAVKTFAGASVRETLGEELCAQARALARREGVSLFVVLFAVAQAMFARLSRNENVVLIVPMGGQALLDDQNLVGHCVNFLPVPAPLSFAEPIADHIKAVDARLNEVLDHRDYTLGSLVADLRVPRSPDRTPLSDIQFNLERLGSRLVFEGLASEVRANPKAFVNFDLFLNLIEGERDIAVEVDFATDLFDEATISAWIDYLRAILAEVTRAPGVAVGELPSLLLSAPSASSLPAPVNVAPGDGETLPTLFERWCDATPEATAVVFGAEALSYREAEARANRLAARLAERLPAPGARIAVAVERSLDLPLALLAVAKAGHAYVPIDPRLPAARVRQMIEAAGIAAFVTSGALPAAEEAGLPILNLSRDAASIAAASPARAARTATADDPTAYVIFTSGSTGAPKGVEIGHAALTNFLRSMAATPGFAWNDRIVAMTTVSFDIAVLELLLPLCCGASTVVAGDDTLANPPELIGLIASSGATVLQATPTMWRVLLQTGFKPTPGLKALCGGEPLPSDLADMLIASGVALWNMYGPTETTIWSACGRITDARQPIAIGAPIANTELHILDESESLAPIGVTGELYIGGLGLAKGYIGRPDLTENSFRLVSLGGAAPRRLYRTGDLAVRHANGAIQLLGRRDQQIKLRGFRIEVEEIETVLRGQAGVRDVAVVVERAGTQDAILTAAYVTAEGISVTPEALRRAVADRLPAYMAPGRFVSVADLPRTTNGKLDREALVARLDQQGAPAVRPETVAAAAPTPAVDPVLLRNVTAVIETVLGREGVQPGERIFSLGATSLHIFRMVARFGEAGLPLRAQNLMTNPSVEEIARCAASLGASQPNSGPSLIDFKRGRTNA
ncbi:amino acid adenylation domain-containing protein [Rhodoblastus acidophilus]|uniref:non-ribosomal peptide synthetase/type I polyketide synthase n=1 Tax=Rhodoblastus acidophilus TaxID=1074 RepID=UPI0022258E9D|nr:non-ribosomal peptide synthetase/type I polyketide synthase [Rhodoblastus acidophilus]MCW2283819.1 amino acid adenylation domain-containing protein [Rhodoblastus acidophilus]MCW2332832.1 amino acid adenylation domain-containing protein [Rhodoblastus acidophilus]